MGQEGNRSLTKCSTYQLEPGGVRRVGGAAPGALGRQLRAISGRRGPDDLAVYVSEDEARAVLGSLHAGTPLALLCRFLWQSGARISEALGLTAGDLDFGAGTARVRTLKRHNGLIAYRLVPLQTDLLGELAQYIAHCGIPREGRIWQFGRVRAFKAIRKAMLAVGVPIERCHPHAWRHGHAIMCLNHGVALTIIQEQLGHSSITTTSVYLKVTMADRKRELGKVPF